MVHSYDKMLNGKIFEICIKELEIRVESKYRA